MMTTDYLAAPENTAQSLAPNELIRLLIGSTVEEVERALVVQTLARCDGNRTRAARVLGLSVRTLRNKIRVYTAEGIEVPATSADYRAMPPFDPHVWSGRAMQGDFE